MSLGFVHPGLGISGFGYLLIWVFWFECFWVWLPLGLKESWFKLEPGRDPDFGIEIPDPDRDRDRDRDPVRSRKPFSGLRKFRDRDRDRDRDPDRKSFGIGIGIPKNFDQKMFIFGKKIAIFEAFFI